MQNNVILVDLWDEPIGTAEKMEVHEKGMLHRAFSVFLYHGNKILLQKRAKSKYHCPELWTNSCCSHPRPNEATDVAAIRRVKEELGIDAQDIKEVRKFFYRQQFSNGLTEFECDHVFIGEIPADTKFVENQDEVDEVAWWDIDELYEKLRENPDMFTPWFLICAPDAIDEIRKA